MIIYQETKGTFLADAFSRNIEDVVQESFVAAKGSHAQRAEVDSWRDSLMQMAKVLNGSGLPDDCGVAIEFHLPGLQKRIDFIVTGRDHGGRPTMVIVELKRWSHAVATDKDGVIIAHRGGKATAVEGAHPSYQAWSYAQALTDFSPAVEGASLQPCAYLHNYVPDGQIDNVFYENYIRKAPLFFSGDRERGRLRSFLEKHLRKGDRGALLYRIEGGEVRPTKSLMDCVASMLNGNEEFVLLDDQKVVFEEARLRALEASLQGSLKQVVIVQGGPGTGKSVVAVRLLADLISAGQNARYVSKNAAPRAVYKERLAGMLPKSRIDALFYGSGSFIEAELDAFHTLIVDEAHRLTRFSGLYNNQGENQIRELINASRCAIFFVDDDQQVTLRDIGLTREIRRQAQAVGAQTVELELTSQFRCSGSGEYLNWLDGVLQVRESRHALLDTAHFDFRIIDSAAELHRLIEERNSGRNRSRVVAGYCWPWQSRKNALADDIILDEGRYRRQWNLTKDGSRWLIAAGSIDQVGCIHTCQGLELDYVGVIIGPDLTYDGAIITSAAERDRGDMSLKGLKSAFPDAAEAEEVADRIIKNTYRTLMTRGMKGCFVYCTDPALAEYFRGRLVPTHIDSFDHAPLQIVRTQDRDPDARYLPVLELEHLATATEGLRNVPRADFWIRTERDGLLDGLFAARVNGESLNQRVPNGSMCLFRAEPASIRRGRVVMVQHPDISDPELGGSYTVKVYGGDTGTLDVGARGHRRVVLRPDSDQPAFEEIVIHPQETPDLAVIAEMVEVLGITS